MKKLFLKLSVFACVICSVSCSESFLEIKPDIRQRIPNALSDYLGLIDNTTYMNYSSHALGIIGSDEFYMTSAGYNSFPNGVIHNYQKRAYTWERQIFQGGESSLLDWNDAYSRILWANVILDGLANSNIANEDIPMVNLIKGSALFHRAFNYYNLAQLFCPVYEYMDAHEQLGLPLRLDSDLTTKISRSNLGLTYNQVLADLKDAVILLPESAKVNYRPSRAAALALLARVKLQMGDYDAAYKYADECLGINKQLLDYNNLTFENNLTFNPNGEGNPEVIFMATVPTNTTFLLLPTFHYMNADTNLVASYDGGDLRVSAYWLRRENGTYQYRGSYDGSNLLSIFTGLAIDEMYLIRAECAARLGNVTKALEDINMLRKNRIKRESYSPLVTSDRHRLLDLIIEERRKELVLRGTRWEDIRRLNKEPRYQLTLTRNLDGIHFEILPGDPRYVWPIPVEAIELGGYQQNLR